MNRESVIGYAKDMGIELDSMALERLEILEHRLLRWNEHINLTAITDEDGIAVKHFAFPDCADRGRVCRGCKSGGCGLRRGLSRTSHADCKTGS